MLVVMIAHDVRCTCMRALSVCECVFDVFLVYLLLLIEGTWLSGTEYVHT